MLADILVHIVVLILFVQTEGETLVGIGEAFFFLGHVGICILPIAEVSLALLFKVHPAMFHVDKFLVQRAVPAEV